MGWNNIIPIDILFDLAKRSGYMEQLSLIETVPEYTIDEKFLCDVPVGFSYINERGHKRGTMSSVDHPGFAQLRDHLEHVQYIKTTRNYINGDIVLKPFKLNQVMFEIGDRFPCAAAMKYHL